MAYDGFFKQKTSIASFVSPQLEKYIKQYGEAGKKAIVEIHHNIIDEWFGEYNSESMKNTIVAKYESRMYEDGKGKIYVYAYADSSRYNYGQSIQGWNERNGIGMSSDLLVEYVMSLQLFEGIIGLPKDGTKEIPEGTPIWGKGHLDDNNRWVNDNFIKKEPLLNYIQNSGQWSRWESAVNSFL